MYRLRCPKACCDYRRRLPQLRITRMKSHPVTMNSISKMLSQGVLLWGGWLSALSRVINTIHRRPAARGYHNDGVLPVTIAKEETQARLPSTKKQIHVLTAVYHNRAVVSTGGPALFDARNHAPNWLTPLTIRYHVLYVLYLHISTHTGYRVCFRLY